MSPKLFVLVHVDPDDRRVIIKVAGALTTVSQQGMYPLIRRARALTPGIEVTVDLTGLTRFEAAGARLLQEALHRAELTGRGAHVRLLLPQPSPTAITGAGAPDGAEAVHGAAARFSPAQVSVAEVAA
ncbi:STAS domain-containing protein [Kocuria sp. CPCC 205300]|uniref:STAS domain-containing protein n=1 Tax=Kocuria sabuli TaxID=3071448 RepID=UPI0036DEC932